MCGFFMEKLSDAIVGIPHVTIIGNHEMYIENFCGLLEYETDQIRIQTKTGKIHIKGKNLYIEYYTNEEMKILGIILDIEYIQGGAC